MNLKVIVPFRNGHSYIDQLVRTLPENLGVIIVDDVSDEGLENKWLNTQVERLPERGFFTGAVNRGIQLAGDSDVLILNQDVEFSDGRWLSWLEEQAQTYDLIGERIKGDHPAWPDGYMHGTFMFIKNKVVQRIGLMDAEEYPLWGSTCEYQLRAARAGFRWLAEPHIPSFVHHRGTKPYGSSIYHLLQRQPELKSKMIATPPYMSVVVNAYNHARYLPDLMHSLIGGETSLGHHAGQSFGSFEVVVVDDGSTDETAEVMERYTGGGKGIRYIYQRNQGSAAAMNTAIRAAHGTVIAPIDSDDMMQANRLAIMLATLRQQPDKFIYDDIIRFDEGGFQKRPNGEVYTLPMGNYNWHRLIHRNIMHKGLMYWKRAWKEAGGYPEEMNKGREDWGFNIALGLAGWAGYHLAGYAGYWYRRHESNRTKTNTTIAMRQQFYATLQRIFPRAYTGEYMCCGNQQKQAVTQVASLGGRNMSVLPGASDGMVEVIYNIPDAGQSDWFGPVTGTRYVFGGKRTRAYIDARDWPGMSKMTDGATAAFSLASPAPAQTPEPAAAETVVETVDVSQFDPYAGLTVGADDGVMPENDAAVFEAAIDAYKGNSTTVPVVRAFLADEAGQWSREELEAMLQHERANKNRSTAIDAFEEVLSNA